MLRETTLRRVVRPRLVRVCLYLSIYLSIYLAGGPQGMLRARPGGILGAFRVGRVTCWAASAAAKQGSRE